MASSWTVDSKSNYIYFACSYSVSDSIKRLRGGAVVVVVVVGGGGGLLTGLPFWVNVSEVWIPNPTIGLTDFTGPFAPLQDLLRVTECRQTPTMYSCRQVDIDWRLSLSSWPTASRSRANLHQSSTYILRLHTWKSQPLAALLCGSSHTSFYSAPAWASAKPCMLQQDKSATIHIDTFRSVGLDCPETQSTTCSDPFKPTLPGHPTPCTPSGIPTPRFRTSLSQRNICQWKPQPRTRTF